MSSFRYLVTCICVFVTPVVVAAPGPPATPAECDRDLQIAVTEMDFGSYVGGAAGTITMDATGVMIPGGIVLLGGGGVPATFDLTPVGKNCDKYVITLTLPNSITINNISGSPGTTITISNLVTNIPGTTFKIKDYPQITIGGTLTANTGDAHAPYTGNFDVGFTF